MDINRDMTFGQSQNNFFHNTPEAPAQVVLTRLLLWFGEWFLDTTAGVPYNTEVLGKYTESTRDPLMRATVLATPGVKSIISYGSQLNRDTREFSVQIGIDTIYGQATLTGPF
jgi:hypothetical protein